MARLIIEQTTGLTTAQSIIDLIRDVYQFMLANPTLVSSIVTTKTAVSTVQADGDCSGGATSLVSALSDFVTDGVVAGDYVTIIKSDEEANIGTWRVVSVTDLNTLVLDADLTSDTGMSFTVDRNKSVRYNGDGKDINIFMID